MRLLGLESADLSIMIVGDRAIRTLNRDYRKTDRATDVLSFAQLEDRDADGPADSGGTGFQGVNGAPHAGTAGRPGLILGDVVISVETALRQARARRVAPAARLRALLIHGLLHLLGYDHERSPAEARLMFARERELAARLAARDRTTGIRRGAGKMPAPRKETR